MIDDKRIDGLRIVASDLTPLYCPWGIRAWFRQHDLDFPDFLRNGVPAATLLATGDTQAKEAVERKLASIEGAA